MRFTDAMWAEIAPIYEAILALPFNRELAAGTLGRERFLFYMMQDAHYLGAFARALATAAAKADDARGAGQARRKRQGRDPGRAGAARRILPRVRRSPSGSRRRRPRRPAAATATSCRRRRTGTRSPSRSRRCCPASRSTTRSASGCTRSPHRQPLPALDRHLPGRGVRRVGARGAGHHRCRARRGRRGRAQEMRDGYLKATRYEWMFWDSAYRLEAWPI